MAKGKTPKKQFSIEDLMNLYVDYLFDVGNIKSERTAKVYRQQIEYFFSENSSYFGDMSTQEKNFLGLLPKLLCTNKYEGKYSDRNKKELHIDRNKKELPASDGLIMINDICKGIDVHFFKKDENKTKTKQNLQSYIRKFFKFIKVVSGQEKIVNKYVKFYSSNKFNEEYSQPKLTPADIAVLSGENGEIYLHSVLFTKFKSRLRCQDRTSGDKIWLPLRFIAKLFNQTNNKIEFSKWLDSLVNNIYINYRVKDNNKVKVKSVKFMGGDGKDDVHLKIDNGHVYVRWVEGDKLCDFLPVLTSTGRGNQKREMEVNSVSEIAIDHVKAIDCTLRELQFKVLPIVSEKYKKFKEQDIPEEQENAKEKELAQELCNNINLGDLIKDLEAIRDDGPLRLMASKYNSQKSNGDTYLKILKRKDGSYLGILEEEIRMANELSTPDSSVFTLYQDLTDDLNEKGNLLITSNEDRVKGTDFGFTLDDIINLV